MRRLVQVVEHTHHSVEGHRSHFCQVPEEYNGVINIAHVSINWITVGAAERARGGVRAPMGRFAPFRIWGAVEEHHHQCPTRVESKMKWMTRREGRPKLSRAYMLEQLTGEGTGCCPSPMAITVS